MRKIISFCTVIVMIAIMSVASAVDQPLVVGGQLPDIQLAVPKDSAEKGYLGFWGFGSFKIPEIKSRVVIIEIFSMYCPYCQREAPYMNQLYAKIEQDPALKGKIKLIGIGAANTLYEVGVFKTKYNVPFPLFPDGDLAIHKKVGGVRTPYFIGVNINADGSHQIFYTKLGVFDNVDEFLGNIIKLSGLK